MNAERLLDLYEKVAEAPDAVPRLRRFVLDLAVRGKLVPQDAGDEPASELLKRIAAEKARLVKAKAIRKPKTMSPISTSEHLAHQPHSWGAERLGNLSTVITKGSTPTSYGHEFTAQGINFLKVESIVRGRVDPVSITSFIEQRTHEFLGRSQLEAGDILFSIAGSIGTCALVTSKILPANTNQALAIIRGTSLAYEPDFLILLLRSFVSDAVKDKARGGAMNNVSLTDLQNLVVPLPPLAEQRRIVAKVEELLALLDRLEAARTAREATRDRLTAASLARLTAPGTTAEDFPAHARFTLATLSALTTRPDQIKPLRQTILNLAVRGKLVDQDPTDEPASELWKRITAEKTRLVKAGAIRREQPLLPISDADRSVELPDGWVWVRLGTLSQFVTSGSRDWAKHYSNEGAIFIRMGNLSKDNYRLRLDQIQRVNPPADGEGTRTRLEAGDILISITGDVGMLGLIPEGFGEAYINQHTAMVRPMPEMRGRYLAELFRSPFAQDQFNEPQRGIKNSFRLTDVTQFVVPLPPLAEQHRIVAKVDALMALCDRLEAALRAADATRVRLLEALLHEALTPAAEAVTEAAE